MAWLPKVKKYFENMGKTAKYIAVSEFNEAMPMFEATRESNEDLIRDTKKSFKQRRLFKEIYKQTGISDVFKSGSEMMRNAKSSLKSGEFYNKARAKKASDKTLNAIAGFDLSDFDNLDFGEEDESENDLNNQGDMFKSLESDLDSGFEANAEAVSSSVLTSAEYTAETIKGAASLSYSQSMKQIQTLRLGFDTLNKGIGSILKFNQDQLQKHIMNSTQFFESTSKLLTEQNAMVKEMLEMQRNLYKAARTKDVNRREDPLEEILNPYTGAINLKAYGKAVKGNLENNAWFMMGKMMWDMRHELIANPIEFLFRNTLMAIGGEKVKGKLEDLQKTVIGSLATLNARLLKTAKKDGGILGTIASIFGIEAPDRAKVDTGKFEKGPMQFNGAANKAITEVIPTYLARIEAALTGSPAKFYNMETGKWNTAKELKESLNKEKNERDLDDFKEKFRDILAEFGTFTGTKQKEIEEAYDAMYKQIIKNEGLVSNATYKTITDDKEREKQKTKYKEEMGLTGASDEIVELFSQIMDHKAMQSTRNQLALAVRNKKGSNADLVARIMSDPNSPYNPLVNGALRDTTDAVFTDINLSTGLTKDKHKKVGHNEVNLLNANRDILINMNKELYYIRNILQFGREAFKGGLSGGSLGGNLKIPSISKAKSKIGYGLNFNFQEDFADKIDRPSSRLFTKMNVDEFANIDNVFKKLIDLVDPNDNLDSLNTKLNEEASRTLRTSIVQYVTHHYDELIENLDENDDYNLIYFYKSIVNGVVQDSNKSTEIWNINKNPFLRSICREIIRYKNPSTKSGDTTIKNTNSIDDTLNKLIEKEKEKTSKEKLDKFSGNGFFEKFKNAKGLDKLSVIKHQLGSFIDTPVNFISNALDSLNNGIYNITNGDFGFIKDGINRLTGKAYGDKNLSKSGLYVLSKGEAVIPSHLNPWNPNRSSADPRKDAQSENNLLARLSQSGVPISGSFAEGASVVNPGNNDNKSIIEKVRDTVVGAGNKLSMFIDSNTGNAITVTKEKAEDIVDKAQTKVEELQDKATSLTGKVFEYFKNTFSDTLGRGAGGALIGGLLTGGNPLGILLGGSVSILMGMAKKSNIITDTLFGNNFDKKGISKYIPASIRKQAKNIKDYGIAGSIAGLGIGALGGPLGLVGGALLGSTVGYLKDNDEAKTLLFGPGLGENLKKLFKTKEKMKYTAVGGTIGGLLGGPLGVVGGALVGSGLSFVTTSEQFKEMMFGKKEGDKVVKEGLLQKMDRFFGDSFKENRKKFADYITEAITGPIERAMVPVGTALQVGVKNAVKGLEKALKNFVQADISSRWGRLGQSIRKNKWMSGAVGGALGGMMMGGPIGGILGGVLGSVAHGTGADAKLFELGKNISLLPGKGLDFISNKLTKWELRSGNAFNLTAEERLNAGGDSYKNTSYGKADTALSKMNKSELIMLQSLIKGIDDLDGATKYAMEELMRAIDRVLAVSGLSIDEQDEIKEILANNKEKTNINEIISLIEKSTSITLDRKTKVIDELKPRIETFISTMTYVESLKDRGVRDAAIKTAAKQLGINASELQDKDNREKFAMYGAKEIANREGEDKVKLKAQDVALQAGDKVVEAVGVNVTKIMNLMRLLHTEKLKDDTIKVYFDAFGNAKMYREITTPNGDKDIEFINSELNANSEEEEKRIKEAILGTYKNTEKIADNTDEDKDKKKKEVKKPTKTSSIMEALKGVFGAVTKPFKEIFGMVDGFMNAIPLVGDLWNYGKMKTKTGARYVGNKIKNWFESKLMPYKSKGQGWINKQRGRLGDFTKSDKYKGYRNISNWLQGKIDPDMEQFYRIKYNIETPYVEKGKKYKSLNEKGVKGFNLTKKDRDFVKKIKDASINGTSIDLSKEDLDRINRITAQGKGIDRETREILNKTKKNYIENANKIRDEKVNKKIASALKKNSFDRFVDVKSRAYRLKYTPKNLEMMMRNGWYDTAMKIFSIDNKYAQSLGKKMLSDKNKERVVGLASKFSKIGATGVKYGSKVLGGAAKIAGKWGGKVLGAVFDVIDSMAITNAMNDASESVQIDEKQPEQALPIIAKYVAGIAASMPLIGEAIKRGPVDGLGDLMGAVAENGGSIAGAAKGALGKVKGKGLKGAAKGILSIGKGLLKGKGLKGAAIGAAALGIGYVGNKLGIISEATAMAGAEISEKAARLTSFFSSAYSAICKVASKFLSPEKAQLLKGLGGKILEIITKPKIIAKFGGEMIKKIAGIVAGPAGWAVIGAFAAKAFYDGFSNAVEIWDAKKDEVMTIGKKVICGLASAIADFCCLDLIMPLKQIVGMIKSALGYTAKELEEGATTVIGAITEGKIPTIFNIKDKLNQLSDSIFNVNIGDAIKDNIWTPFKDFVSTLWGKITEKINKAFESIKEYAEKLSDWWKNFSVSDTIKGLFKTGKEWLNKLFDFDVKEKSKQLIQEDANQLEVRQLDEEDNELVEKYKASLNLNTGISFSSGKKSSSRGNIGNLKDIAMKQQMAKGKRPRGDGGYFGIGDGGTNGVDNAQYIWDYLSAKGLGSSAIAGIMGNIQQESGFMPNRVQGYGVQTAPEITVDGETGYGLCQWTYPTRQQALLDYARSKGKSSSDMDVQLDFMLQEVNQRDSGLLGRMAKMDPHSAAKAFHDSYEGSADDADGVARRGNFATEIFRKNGRGITTTGTYTAPSSSNVTLSTNTGNSSTGTNIFDSVIKRLEGGALGKLGAALFGSSSFFTSGISGILGNSFGGGNSGGAGSSRSYQGSGTPRGKGNPNDKGVLTEEPEEGAYWVRQTSGVTLKGCHVQVLDVLDCLGKFFFEKTGKKLVVTAGTNGQHAQGEYSHAAGWKVDVNDWYGPEGLSGGWITEGAPFTQEFKRFGHDNGLGMADEGDHVDVQFADGYDWQDGQYYGGWDAVHGGKNKSSVVDFLTNSLHGNITGKFGESRDGGPHGGIDIATSMGTSIISPISGRVSNIGIEPAGYGNYIQIKDDKGKYHLFGHLQSTPNLELNNKIEPGQTIGFVGSSGKSTGPHVHYQIDPESNHRAMKAGQHIDPSTYMIDQSTIDKINANNSSVADFKRNEYIDPNSGDGGIGERFTKLADIATFNKENLEGLKPIDYEQKFDMIIQLLSSIVSLLGGGNKASNFNANINTNTIPTTIAGGIGGGLTNTPKFATTAPGKSIESILANMIKLAKGT